jgi:cell wall-associated NlpC family hydrolase
MKSLLAVVFAFFLVTSAPSVLAQDTSNPPQFTTDTATVSDSYLMLAQDLVLNAMGFLGIPYRWGGATPEAGFDCAGLVQYVFKQALGTLLPRSSYDMGVMGLAVGTADLLPGDLVFFNTLRRPYSHVGIYIGENRFIHAPRRGKNVEIVDMSGSYWQQRYNGARRLAQ